MEINTIMVPAFADEIIDKTQCDHCEKTGDWWIKGAGARLDVDNRACFAVTLWCNACEAKREMLFSSRPFEREEWWQDVHAWFTGVARPDRVGTVLRNMPLLRGLVVMCRTRQRINQLSLYGGYAGACGPVVLLYRRERSSHPQTAYGVARLEPHRRLRFLPSSDPEALGVTKWLWFSELPHDAKFGNKGLLWHKLSPDRIRAIVEDYVYDEWRAGHRRSRAPKSQRRLPRRRHHDWRVE